MSCNVWRGHGVVGSVFRGGQVNVWLVKRGIEGRDTCEIQLAITGMHVPRVSLVSFSRFWREAETGIIM